MVFKNKRGIGIIEVMVAALVLGILYAAVSNLQKGNRETLLRIRGRDGATEVAQNIIDEISAQGLASFTDDKLIPCTDDEGTIISNCFTLAKFAADGSQVTGEDGKPIADQISVTKTWEGQPGLKDNTMTVNYTVDVKFSSDEDYKGQAGSLLLTHDLTKNCGDPGITCTSHVYAKRIEVTVSWPFKNSIQSISVSGVIR